MPERPKYRKPVAELEREARVRREDQLETVEPVEVPAPDPRGELPDREWFAAGG